MTIGDVDGGSGIVTVNGSGASDSRLDVGDILTVGNGGQGTLNIEAGADVDVGVDLNVGNNASSPLNNFVSLTGAGTSLAVSGVTNIGLAGRGTLSISAGATFSGVANVFLGEIDDAVGMATVDGAGSQFTTAASLFVGNEGFGALNVTAGGFVQAAGAFIGDSDVDNDSDGQGMVLVDGSDGSSPSTLNVTGATFAVGGSSNENGGLGTLNISGGGLVNASGMQIGSGDGGTGDGTGTVNVAGAGSLLDADANGAGLFLVGDTGAGTLNVNAGGKVEAAAARIGNEAGSETAAANIDGAGSQIDVSAAINVGQDRAGSLSITAGGVLVSAKNNTSTSTIGVGSNADGSTVAVSGAGSLWNNQGTAGASTRLRIGQAAGADVDGQRARLEVTGGGKVMAHDLLVADGSVSGAGEIVIDGQDGANNPSTISANGFVVIGDDSVGRLTVSGGGRFELTGTGFFDIGGTTNGEGFATVTGAGSIIDVGGSFRVGRSSGGNLTIADGGTVNNAGDGVVARDNSAGPSTVTVGSTTADESTWNNAGSLFLGGDELGGGGTATVQINPSGTISAVDAVKIWSGTTTLAGGTLSMGSLEIVQLGQLQFNAGTIRFTGDKTLDGSALVDIFGSQVGATLDADQRLEIVGAATLSSPLRLNHATAALRVGAVADLANLDWDAGALSVTAQDVAIESGGLFNNVLIIGEDQALNVPNNSLTVGSAASFNVIRGFLSAGNAVNNGLTVLSEADGVDFDADNDGIGFTNNSDLVVIDTTVAGNVTNNGRIETLGNVTFLDNLALQPGGTVDFDLGGTGAGEFDALTILGDVTLDGLLNVTLESGFSLSAGDSFDIIDVDGAVSGTFVGLADGALVGNFGGVDLFIDYASNVVSLITGPGADVDLDDDGDVDGRDFLAIQQTDPALVPAWESGYGNGVGVASSLTTGIPEPTTLGLLAASCFLAFLRGSPRS